MKDTERKNLFTAIIGPKKAWRQYRARVKNLPKPYAQAVEGVQRYLFHFGAVNGADAMALFDDVIELFERAAADGTPLRDIVGEDPVEFVEALIRNYDDEDGYVARQRNRLRRVIDEAVDGSASAGGS